MIAETLAYVLIGLAVGSGAVRLLPGYFPAGRLLTVATAVVAALLGGLITRFALDAEQPGLALGVAVIGSGLLVSVLARPDQVTRPGGNRRHRPA